jgi:hypothetical protein
MPNASGRRHKQALNGFKHLAKRQRPNYKIRDKQAAMRKESEFRARQRKIQENKSKKNSK